MPYSRSATARHRRPARAGRNALAVALAALAALLGLTAPAAVAAVPSPAVSVIDSCPHTPGRAWCLAEHLTGSPSAVTADVATHTGRATAMSPALAGTPATAIAGYRPADLASAYGIPRFAGTPTVAVIDAFDAPHVAGDLATYRAQFGLPPCTGANGCFRKVNQSGAASPLPAAQPGWAEEATLDVDMVSAICPSCHILLVEADDDYLNDLSAAAAEAVTLGAHFVSMSWGGAEWSGEAAYDAQYLDAPGVVYTAAAGDSAYGTSWPAVDPDVVAVGGTSLRRTASGGWQQQVWGGGADGTGSGCSAFEARANWQIAAATAVCARRAVNDVAMDADPNTGVAVYSSDAGGWSVFGGTSAATPMVAALYAIAGTPPAGAHPASFPYTRAGAFRDVTGGSNGTCSPARLCSAAAGWDGPTGLGTPFGVSGLRAPSPSAVFAPGIAAQADVVGASVDIDAAATDSNGAALTYSAAGLPAGTSIGADGHITGAPSVNGSYAVIVTARASDGSTGSASFAWTVRPSTAVSSPSTVTVGAVGPHTGYLGVRTSIAVHAADSAGQALSWTATGLPPGMTLDARSGVISGTPGATGRYPVVVTAADGNGARGAAGFTWTVDPTPWVGVHNPGRQWAWVGGGVRIDVRASDSARLAVTYSARNLPWGLRLSGGYVVGAPHYAVTRTVTVQARDAVGRSAATSFVITTRQHRLVTGRFPVITGPYRVGAVLTLLYGGWRVDSGRGAGTGAVTHIAWYANGRPIARAHGLRYRLPAAVRGKRIAVQLNGSKLWFVGYARRTVRLGRVR